MVGGIVQVSIVYICYSSMISFTAFEKQHVFLPLFSHPIDEVFKFYSRFLIG